MIHLELNIEEVDYEALMDRLLPLMSDQLRGNGNPLGMLLSNGMSASMTKNLLRKLPPSQIEELIADTLNGSSEKLMRRAETAAAQQQVAMKLSGLHATVK